MSSTKLAAFDLDGTLLKGQTVCEAIARGIGHIRRMRELERLQPNQFEEMAAAREEMAKWYSGFTFDELCEHLAGMQVAPGVHEGFSLLRDHGFKIAVVSLTWEFAVEWFSNRWGADYSVGTGLSSDGLITSFWPRDKAAWLTRVARDLGTDVRDVAAVGDSRGDIPMLLSAGRRYWVGQTVPYELGRDVGHEPGGDILRVARRIVEAAEPTSGYITPRRC